MQGLLLKIGIWSIIAIIIGGGGFGLYKWVEHRSDKQLAAIQVHAVAEGRAQAQAETTALGNKALVDAVTKISAMNEATSKNLANIRVQTSTSQQAIIDHDVKTVAVEHPELVEQWANEQTSTIFGSIQKETQ
jgi:hypothetical protein